MEAYELNAIGRLREHGQQLVFEFTEVKLIPAMKNLQLFSHGLFIVNNGSAELQIYVTELLEVDEKKGQIILSGDCGLAAGNSVYDIKPCIPCEDRILSGNMSAENKEQTGRKQTEGRDQLQLEARGMIRRKQGHYFLYPDDFSQFSISFEEGSIIKVLWWFSRFDKKEYRRALQGEPPYENAPRSGVLATRSPVRPNPIALTVAQITKIDLEGKWLEVIGLDCFDQTPLLDIRVYNPAVDVIDDVKVPDWLSHWPLEKQMEQPDSGQDITLDDSEQEQLKTRQTMTQFQPASFNLSEEVKSSTNEICISGARQNNLKNLDAVVPKGKLVAVAGVSGSGKSSFAFDTLYAESRLRLSETMDSLEKPEVDRITGLPPAVAIAQRSIGRNPRSTVGTFTGMQDRLRMLYAAIGLRHCPNCGKAVQPKSRDELAEVLETLSKDHELTASPYEQEEPIIHISQKQHVKWTTVVDTLLAVGKGAFYLRIDGGEALLLQNREMCYHCQTILFEVTPALFSFNHPESMCAACNGLGKKLDIAPNRIVSRPELSLLDGASDYWGDMRAFRKNPTANWMRGELLALAETEGVNLELPWSQLPLTFRNKALYGNEGEEVSWSYVHPKNGRSGTIKRVIEGAVPVLERLLKKGGKTAEQITAEYMHEMTCPVCRGERLAREGRMVTVSGLRYPLSTSMTVGELILWIEQLPDALTTYEQQVGLPLLKEVYQKAIYLKEVGLSYLKLDRGIPTLSGGELQRLKLVAQLGIGLSGLLYIMDEPTAGLHPKDYSTILQAMDRLKKEGNSLLVVEHEEAILKAAEWLIEIGPAAGQQGGEIVWQGVPQQLLTADTQTAQYLTGRKQIAIERPVLPDQSDWIEVIGAAGNNLQGIDIRFPKGRITCITGVSGSGKSTLAEKVLVPALEQKERIHPTETFQRIKGAENIQGVVYASQRAIMGNRRSIVGTFMGVLDEIRSLFAITNQAKEEGLTSSSFSFNNKEGQCDACKGEGVQSFQVPFSADITAVCPLCHGQRYKKSILAVEYEGKNIFEVLELSVEAALTVFEGKAKILTILQVLCDVGLGYLKLGQGTRTLSGGEAQRIKLAKILCKKQSAKMVYVLDEPTSGLHFSDIQNLLNLLSTLAAAGHTILIVEHNRQVIRNADWIIDLGPEGGTDGGKLVVQGTPQTVMNHRGSYTGKYLAEMLL